MYESCKADKMRRTVYFTEGLLAMRRGIQINLCSLARGMPGREQSMPLSSRLPDRETSLVSAPNRRNTAADSAPVLGMNDCMQQGMESPHILL